MKRLQLRLALLFLAGLSAWAILALAAERRSAPSATADVQSASPKASGVDASNKQAVGGGDEKKKKAPDDPKPSGKKGGGQQANQDADEAISHAGPSVMGKRWDLVDEKLQQDFPALACDHRGNCWIAYLEHDGQADLVKLARTTGDKLDTVATLSDAGIAHQPAVACDAAGGVWTFWGQVDARDIVTLRARRFVAGQLQAATTLAESAGSDTFADAATDHAGRVWVAWQSLRRGQADVFVRWLDPQSGKWSAEIAVSKPEGGNWEPRLALDGRDGAWVAFDSSRNGQFDLYLAHVSLGGQVHEHQLTNSPEYEARASVCVDSEGKGLWIAAERGRKRWGQLVRGHESENGLNAQKQMLLGYFDFAAEKFREVDVAHDGRLAPRAASAVNLPTVGVDREGNPWLAYRYFGAAHWDMAISRYDVKSKQWSQPAEVPDSSFGQDRRCTLLCAPSGKMQLVWASDKRPQKKMLTAGVYLAELEPSFEPYRQRPSRLKLAADDQLLLHPLTPPRPRDEHHTWTVGGKTYRLLYGDLHRHTDFSNCRTSFDGCVLEAFRYAYDMADLDFLGTSDHTDIAKILDPYEWWQTQRLVDVFYVPGKFNSLYAYEREQRFPWGHRNVVFPQRGAPIVYIQRKNYEASPWHRLYPNQPGDEEITPLELWDLLKQYGKPVAIISHTGATSMGTDWDRYERIDGDLENTVEIYQGARVSYEGLNVPQPTVGLRVGQKYQDSPGTAPDPIDSYGSKFDRGVYQRALSHGFKLGVFASSDHISQHASYGGVYVEETTRLGIIHGFAARHSLAATDKIFVEFSCNDQPMGSIFTTSKNPEFKMAIDGTASISRVTLVRNESNYKTWEPADRHFSVSYTDPEPPTGEGRYYLRVEQVDGNMAWSSPVWVKME